MFSVLFFGVLNIYVAYLKKIKLFDVIASGNSVSESSSKHD